jgi:dTDP-glucose pyrophosphorylase/predicted transcriptional regulator
MALNWKNILIPPSATIAETIAVIDKGAMQFALVVDTKNKLLGVVTDGDIRRALISHLSMDIAIEQVMNDAPFTAELGITRSRLLHLMNTKGLLAIPIIDNGILVGLETLQKIVERTHYDNPVFLMAGGFGTRLKPLTDNCPKPLLKLAGKPILETIIDNFIAAGFHRFYISTHYLPEKIRSYFGDGSKWGVEINYVHEESPLGTGGALGLLPKNLPNLPVIMMNGDLLTKVDFELLLNFHSEQNSLATMCVTEYEYQVPYGVVTLKEHQLVSMIEKPKQKFFVNAGIYVVNPALIKQVGENQVIDMPSLIEEQITKNEKVSVFPVHEYWLDIGKFNDFNQAKIDMQNEF